MTTTPERPDINALETLCGMQRAFYGKLSLFAQGGGTGASYIMTIDADGERVPVGEIDNDIGPALIAAFNVLPALIAYTHGLEAERDVLFKIAFVRGMP